MTMKSINILHLSDLHFGSPIVVPMGDLKDEALSQGFVGEITERNPRIRFIADLRRLTDDTEIDVIACTGDLGFRGNKNTLSEGIEYLNTLAKDFGVRSEHVIISPGNHDLDRDADCEHELNEFWNLCQNRGFAFAQRTTPAVVNDFGAPIIALNSCLGGTEHALHGNLSKEFWKAAREELREREEKYKADGIIDQVEQELKYQLEDMDIPALGYNQLDQMAAGLTEGKGNCAIILMHHNPVPTTAVDIRPYANLIDAGQLISRLVERGRRVVVMHGHTHCDSGLTVFPHHKDTGGFVACIGSRGLSGGTNAAATVVELALTEMYDFCRANVAYIERIGDDFQRRDKYVLLNRFRDRGDLDIELRIHKHLALNKTYTFDQAAQALSLKADATLEEKLIQLDPNIIEIAGKKQPSKNWRITRMP